MSEFKFDEQNGPLALMVAMYGMSSSGKTYSALAFATGAASVSGGPVAVIDTESGRALHYHKDYGGPFEFKHLSLEPPYSTARYLAAIDFCIESGAGAIVVDSYSHEHEGIGGVLEQASEELERLTKGDSSRNDAMQGMSWMKPKRARKAMFNRLLQKRIPIVFCFRAKHGTDWQYRDPGTHKRAPRAEGIVPIGDWDTIYEMTVAMLFRSGADGVPDWHPDPKLEPKTATLAKKCPGQFRELLQYNKSGVQITPMIGRTMALWAAQSREKPWGFEALAAAINASTTILELETVVPRMGSPVVNADQKEMLRANYRVRRDAIQGATTHT